MAKQSSHIKFQGTIGDITYVKTPDGYHARPKTIIPKERFQKDPAFEKLRENSAEFTVTVNAANLFRTALTDYLLYGKDRTASRRLNSALRKVLNADPVHETGKRIIMAQNTVLMKDFEFNETAPLRSVLGAEFTTAINRATGLLEINIPAVVPKTVLKTVPEQATHFQLIMAGIEADFAKETAVKVFAQSGMQPIDAALAAPSTLSGSVTPGSALPLFLVMGIRFYEIVNGFTKINKGKSYNALAIVDVSGS